jgi:DNA repair exonuclease SbcCD ATPase subunit
MIKEWEAGMARKRLSDLLREEAQKSTDSEAEGASAIDNGKRKSTAVARSRKSAKQPPTQVEPVEFTATSGSGKEEELDELKVALERSQARETTLKQELAALQTALDTQEALVKTLKSDLAKVDSLKTELEQAKKAALQLAEENTKLREELHSAHEPQPPADTPAPPAEASTTLVQREVLVKRQADSLNHPIFPAGDSPGRLSDQDLGWVD